MRILAFLAALVIPALGSVPLAPEAAAAPLLTTDDHLDLRPGAPILPDDWLKVNTLHGSTRDMVCTANFVFRDEADVRYIGTAGHCVDVPRGVHTWTWPDGPIARDLGGRAIGHFVYAGSTLAPTAVPLPFVGFAPVLDLALIRLFDDVAVDPQMAHFGGPTGLNEDLTQTPVVLHMYGWGVHGVNGEPEVEDCCAFEQPFHGRTMLALSMPYPDVVHTFGVGGGGDSGSPIISADGRAVGIVSSANYADHRADEHGVSTGTGNHVRLAPQVAAAEAVLGIALTLQTAPLR